MRYPRQPFFTSDNINLLSVVVARQVEDVVALCRQFGVKLPAEYDVGLKIVEHEACDGRCEITIRMDNARQTYKDRYDPYEPRIFFAGLQKQAENLVIHWMNTNPACKLDDEASQRLLLQVRSVEWQKRTLERADEQRQKTTFSRVR